MRKLITNHERGQTLVMFALMTVFLLGVVGLVIDGGKFLVTRRDIQNAADAAALAGAQELPDAQSAVQKAMDWASQNGFTDGLGGATVSAVTPYDGDPNKLEVTISTSLPTVFMGLLGMSSANVSARAVAHAEPGPGYVLFAHAGECTDKALEISGSAATYVGGLHSNSELKINSDVFVDGAGSHVCEVSLSGDITFTRGISQVANERDWPVYYEYEDFPCTYTSPDGSNMKINNNSSEYFVDDDPDTRTLKPGVYCSTRDIHVNANNITGNVTFVAKGKILFTSEVELTPYWNDVLALSEDSGGNAISISSSNFVFQGYLLAIAGAVSPSGATMFSESGALYGETISINFSQVDITAPVVEDGGLIKLVE